jgi:hypothetical protein
MASANRQLKRPKLNLLCLLQFQLARRVIPIPAQMRASLLGKVEDVKTGLNAITVIFANGLVPVQFETIVDDYRRSQSHDVRMLHSLPL